MRKHGISLLEFLIICVIVAITITGLIAFFGKGLPTQKSAKLAIEDYGFKDVQNVERHWFGAHYIYGCDGNEAFAFTAEATNNNGKRVYVTACTSYAFKGYTVRMGR